MWSWITTKQKSWAHPKGKVLEDLDLSRHHELTYIPFLWHAEFPKDNLGPTLGVRLCQNCNRKQRLENPCSSQDGWRSGPTLGWVEMEGLWPGTAGTRPPPAVRQNRDAEEQRGRHHIHLRMRKQVQVKELVIVRLFHFFGCYCYNHIDTSWQTEIRKPIHFLNSWGELTILYTILDCLVKQQTCPLSKIAAWNNRLIHFVRIMGEITNYPPP